MKKTIISLLLILCLTLGLGAAAWAAGEPGGTVQFDGKAIKSSFSTATLSGPEGAMKPGDDAKIVIELQNTGKETVDWWLKNTVLENFLATEAGGAYDYSIKYEGKALYDGEYVGGTSTYAESKKGLKSINSTLKDYLYVGSMGAGKSGTLEVTIKLEGDTQVNAYKNSLAKIRLDFAVELASDKVVKTGDETNIIPYLTAAAISGVVLLVLAIVKLDKKGKKQGGQAK